MNKIFKKGLIAAMIMIFLSLFFVSSVCLAQDTQSNLSLGNIYSQVTINLSTSTVTSLSSYYSWSDRYIRAAQIIVDGDSIRCFWNGNTPERSKGAKLVDTTILTLYGDEVGNFKAIIASGGSGTTIYATIYTAR